MREPLPLHIWVAAWRAAQYYFRYSVEGIERLVGAPASLIVGYHGRPFAWDPAMLTSPSTTGSATCRTASSTAGSTPSRPCAGSATGSGSSPATIPASPRRWRAAST